MAQCAQGSLVLGSAQVCDGSGVGVGVGLGGSMEDECLREQSLRRWSGKLNTVRC